MIKAIALLTPVYVSLFWCILFFFGSTNKNKAKKTLGFFMLMATFLYISHTIYFCQQYQLYSFFESVYIFSLLSLYPLFYRYIVVLSGGKHKLKNFNLHFLPAITLSIMSLILTFLLSADERIYYVKSILIENNLKRLNFRSISEIKGVFFLISRTIFIVQTFIYLILGIKLANAHNQRISNYFSDTEGRRMGWVRDISIVILILSSAGIVFSLIGRSYFIKHELILLIPSIFFSTIFFGIGFKANQQVHISEVLIDESEGIDSRNIESQQEPGLDTRLIRLFEVDKIYEHTDLRITTVSQMLKTNRTYISKLINDEFGMNFNDFVNKFRVEKAKQLLGCKENKQYTMEYIAEKSGFGSVASFSRCFKGYEGITPGKFRTDCKS